MWKATFKEVFTFFFDNPVIFLIILANYALMFLFAPILGFVAAWFIAIFYLIGIHGNINDIWNSFKNLSKWGFIVAIILYLLFLITEVVSFFVYNTLIFKFKISILGLFIFTAIYSLLISIFIHLIYVPLFASSNFKEFKNNIKRLKLLFTTKLGVESLIFLWGFMFLTLLAGLIKFIQLTVGLYAVIATFWLTYYTFLAVKVFKNREFKEV